MFGQLPNLLKFYFIFLDGLMFLLNSLRSHRISKLTVTQISEVRRTVAPGNACEIIVLRTEAVGGLGHLGLPSPFAEGREIEVLVARCHGLVFVSLCLG